MGSDKFPLITIITTCRNDSKFLRRAIESVRLQTYSNIEYIIQDACSTDETADIVRQRGLLDGFRSEPDKGALDGLLTAAERAKGEIIGLCWSDDQLLPYAAARAAEIFAGNPGMDIFYGDQIVVDEVAKTTRIAPGVPWSVEDFAMLKFYPPMSSSFYRRDALLRLREKLVVFDHDEFEFWVWAGILGRIDYVPGALSVFSIHHDTKWLHAPHILRSLPGKERAVRNIGRDPDAPAWFKDNMDRIIRGHRLWAIEHILYHCDNPETALREFIPLLHIFDGDPRYRGIADLLVRQIPPQSPGFRTAQDISRHINREFV